MIDLEDLKRRHAEYNAKVVANGVKLISYVVPCCGNMIEDREGSPGETWDTMATCYHCGAHYFKITTATAITAVIPKA